MYAGMMSSLNTRIQEHQHRDYTTDQIIHAAPSKQIPRIIIMVLYSSQLSYRVYFIVNDKYFNLLNLLSFTTLMIFVIQGGLLVPQASSSWSATRQRNWHPTIPDLHC